MKNIKSIIAMALIMFLLMPYVLVNAEGIHVLDYLQKMEDKRDNKEYASCIGVADVILEYDKTNMEAYSSKAISYYMLGEYEKALSVLDEQLKYNPSNEEALYNAACASALIGNKDKAIGYLKDLFSIDTSSKSFMKEDKDLDNIKDSEEYKKLMGISVRVGGELLDLEVTPQIREGRTLVPMRSIFEALNSEITWDDVTKTVIAVKSEINISLSINNKVSKINGSEKEMEVAPTLIDGRTFVPVRFISEALGADVKWDEKNQVIDIITSAPSGKSNDYVNTKKKLDSMIAVSVVDGIWPEPYRMDSSTGMTFIIAKDKNALELMNSLDDKSRAQYMYDTTFDNYALVVGCDPVHMKFVYDGKVYYEGDMIYDSEAKDVKLTYYEKGHLFNVVKQYKESYNYKDFYQLPKAEQVTSKIGD